MNFFFRLFKKAKPRITCPRCLGKGHVDMEDIIRLKQELRWVPGSCAYCNGTGKVAPDLGSKVPVDASYLVNSLSKGEREKILNNDSEAIQKARLYDRKINGIIREIIHLHFNEKMSPEHIADYLLSSYTATRSNNRKYQKTRAELVAYAQKVIESKKGDDQD
jgi:hypothetical protein